MHVSQVQQHPRWNEFTYHRECDNFINKEVVVKARQICSSAGQELQSSLDLKRDAIRALDEAQDVLILLPNLLVLRREMLEDDSGLADRSQGRDVRNGRVVGERAGTRIVQEVVVLGLQRHLSDGAAAGADREITRERWRVEVFGRYECKYETFAVNVQFRVSGCGTARRLRELWRGLRAEAAIAYRRTR